MEYASLSPARQQEQQTSNTATDQIVSISGFALNLFNRDKNRLAKTVVPGVLVLKQRFEVSKNSFLEAVELFPSNQDLPKSLEVRVHISQALISSTLLYLVFGPNSSFDFQSADSLQGDAQAQLISDTSLWNEALDPDFTIVNDALLRNWDHLDFLKGLTRRDRFFESYSLNPSFTDPASADFIMTTNVRSLPQRPNLFRDFYLNSKYFRRNFQTLLAKSSHLRLIHRDEAISAFVAEDSLVCSSEGRLRILSHCRMKIVEGKPALEFRVAEDYDPSAFAPNFKTRIRVNGLHGFRRKGAMESLDFWGSFNGQRILEQNAPLQGTSEPVTEITEQTPLLAISSYFWESHTEAELVFLRMVIDRFPHEIDPVDDYLILDFPSSFGFHTRYDPPRPISNNALQLECSDRNRPTVPLRCHIVDSSRVIVKFIGLGSLATFRAKDDMGADVHHLSLALDLVIHNILLPNFVDRPNRMRQASDLFFREVNSHLVSSVSRTVSRWLYYSSRRGLNLLRVPVGVFSASRRRYLSFSPDALEIQIEQAGRWLPYFNILGKNYFIREYSDLYLFFGVPPTHLSGLDQLELWLELDPSFFVSSQYVRLTRPPSAPSPSWLRASSAGPSADPCRRPSMASTLASKSARLRPSGPSPARTAPRCIPASTSRATTLPTMSSIF